jgi:hypothetical protein
LVVVAAELHRHLLDPLIHGPEGDLISRQPLLASLANGQVRGPSVCGLNRDTAQ